MFILFIIALPPTANNSLGQRDLRGRPVQLGHRLKHRLQLAALGHVECLHFYYLLPFPESLTLTRHDMGFVGQCPIHLSRFHGFHDRNVSTQNTTTKNTSSFFSSS